MHLDMIESLDSEKPALIERVADLAKEVIALIKLQDEGTPTILVTNERLKKAVDLVLTQHPEIAKEKRAGAAIIELVRQHLPAKKSHNATPTPRY